MKKSMARSHALGGVFVFALLGTFAVMGVLLIMLGAQAYNTVVTSAQMSSNERILRSYPLNKVRMNDNVDALEIRQIEGVDVLTITQDYDGDMYETYVYCYDGWLRELFMAQEEEFYLEDGDELIEAQYFRPKIENGMMSFEIGTADGENYQAKLALRSLDKEGAA